MTTLNAAPRKAALPAVMTARLEDVRRRSASVRLTRGLFDAVALFLTFLFVALAVDWAFTLFSTTARLVLTGLALVAGVIGIVLLAVLPQFRRRSLSELAAEVDRSVPELEERWQTVVTTHGTSSTPETAHASATLMDRVVAESIERERLVDPLSVVSGRSLRKHRWFLAVAIGANVLLFLIDPARAWVLVRRFCAPTSPISLTQITTAGDLAVPRGEPIQLAATIGRRAPENAELFLRNSAGQTTTLALVPTDADGKQFVHELDATEEPFSYRFRAGDAQTEWHSVSIYDRPRLMSVELKLRPPEYTRLPVVTKSELPTSLRVVEGTQLEIAFAVDQPLRQFDLRLDGEAALHLAPLASEPLRYVFRTKLEKTLRITPAFVSQRGLENLRLPTCQFIVYPDRPPEVTIISPEKEITLRPTDEVTVEINARDDFGVVRGELIAFIGDQPDMKNAVVLPPPAESETKKAETPATPGTKTDTSPSMTKKQDLEQQQTEKQNAEKESTAKLSPGEKPAAATESQPGDNKQAESKTADTKATDNKTEASKTAKAPPNTIVMPLNLGSQTGDKNVRANVKLDLRRFQLKQGQQLQYMVRVFDSHATRSNGQSYAGKQMTDSQESDSKSSESAAKSGAKNRSSAKSEGKEKGKDATDKNAAAKSQLAEAAKSPAKTTPAKPSSSKDSRSASQSDKLAEAGKIDASSQNQTQPESPQNPKQAGKTQSAESGQQQAASSSSQQPGSSAEQKNSDPKEAAKDQKEQAASASPPPNNMTQRQLDIESQSSASSTMKIHIDQYAGSFEGQQRHKLELAIDPVLKELDAALARAIEELRPVSAALEKGPGAPEEIKKSLKAADTQIARGQALVTDLVQKSEGTPYAFIGLQLVDITELHISPARLEVKGAKNESPERKQHVAQADFHLSRAREMLADLTKKYEAVKRDLKLAEEMQRIKKMYQTFVEDSLAFLAANRPSLNPKSRKMAELELDEEFLKQYRELQKEWEKTLAELAKALGKDPRLLARYMNLSRRRVDSLRDQLTLLNLRQQELLAPVEKLSGDVNKSTQDAATTERPDKSDGDEVSKPQRAARGSKASGSELVRTTLTRDLLEIAAGTAAVQEDFGTWMPEKAKSEDKQIAALRAEAARVSATASQAVTALGSPRAESTSKAVKRVNELSAQLKTLESSLAAVADNKNSQLAENVNRRLARVRKLEQLAATWTQKQEHVAERRFHRALEIDQHRLSEDTLELTGKLETAAAQLAGLPDDILALADEVKEALRYDVLEDQMSAELRLRDGDLPAAKTHQKKAIDGFARAEDRFNKLIDRVIAEQDKVPPEVPDLDNMQLPTLEELLARLESETDLAETLGIPNRPNNLQGLRDWLMRSGSDPGAGNGMGANGARQAQLLDKARLDALRAARNANKRDAKPVATAARWNTLGSRLEDVVRQGRGNTPPRQYRRAIERYFELISSGANGAEAAPPKKEAAPAPAAGPTNTHP